MKKKRTIQVGHGSRRRFLLVVLATFVKGVEQIAQVRDHSLVFGHAQHAQVPFTQPVAARQLLPAGVAMQNVVITLHPNANHRMPGEG